MEDNQFSEDMFNLSGYYSTTLEKLLQNTREGIVKECGGPWENSSLSGRLLVKLQMLEEVDQSWALLDDNRRQASAVSPSLASQERWEQRLPLFRDNFELVEPLAALRGVILSLVTASEEKGKDQRRLISESPQVLVRHLKLLMTMAKQSSRPAMVIHILHNR